jgi:hypothetical protein
MREIPAEISDADLENELSKVPSCDEVDLNTLADSGEGKIEEHIDSTIMPAPSNE